MAVADETIIEKMIQELQKANKQSNQSKKRKHIENVRLLCDLFLPEKELEEDFSSNDLNEEITPEEMKAMLGETNSTTSKSNTSYRKTTALDEDDANGKSLFDF
ncbi:hypothetical protein SAMN05216389_12515 [Oceanobacillus limi]|uniref:YwdI family protein n=1 Tax=Oceanobacillus limi TaxID=930131 RepID=A0A1I0GYH3_9BACI|nr:YwdI family protein [Oceanobacillus limi]SET75594.1 hypothetical protein SAMN05216389_12515 [Oceanobacillus limi]